MKKIIIVLVICMICILLLCACAKNTVLDDSSTSSDISASDNPDAPKETDEVEETEQLFDTSYTIETECKQEARDDGLVLAEAHFQKLVFTHPDEVLSTINNRINEECNKFFTEGDGSALDGFYNSFPDETKATTTYQLFNATYDVMDVLCDDDFISIRYRWDWYAGGVHNYGYVGFVFDRKTGKEICYKDLFTDEDTAKSAFVTAANELIDSKPDTFFDEAKETVLSYNVDDIKFGLAEGKILVYIPQYELGTSASGSFIIEIPQ